jgi:molybdopterin-containing oxidoreductase family molybdopterin binding subunit
MTEEKIVYTACQGWGCHDHCMLETHVVNGKIERTQRRVLPLPEGDWPGICQKGIMAGKLPYMDNRLRYPLKRVGKRGEGNFERISWDQALDEIGAKLNEIKANYGSEAVGIQNFPCGVPPVNGLWNQLNMRFANVFGATLQEWPTIDTGAFLPNFVEFGTAWYYWKYDPRQLANANYIILWGTEPFTTRPGWTTRYILDAQEKGAKVVMIGLAYDVTAAKADWFIPVKPGHDTALALAMARLMIEENLYDEQFLASHTVAPFLVREDNGKFLRESDIIEGGFPGRYVVWTKAPAKPVGISAHTFDLPDGLTPDLHASITVRGIPCKTAFVMLREHVAEFTPEYQEHLTGVPPETLRQLTYEYCTCKPAAIFLNWGGPGRYINGGRTGRSVFLLTALSGNLGLKGGRISPGGGFGFSYDIDYNDAAVVFPDGLEGAKAKFLRHRDLTSAVKEGKPRPIKAMLSVAGNVLHSLPSRQVWEGIFTGLDLLVVYEIRMTDTAMWADYVLPDVTVFEKYDLIHAAPNNQITLQVPAIDRIGEGKPPEEFWFELSKRLGIEKYFDHTIEDYINMRLNTTCPAVANVQPPITFARLKEEKQIRAAVPDVPFDPFDKMDFVTPSGRFEFYCEGLAYVGEAMARYVEPLIYGPLSKDYPLQLYTARSRFFMQTQFTELPVLRKLAGGGPSIRLNPKDAVARDVHDGDIVEVFNNRGSLKVKATTTNSMPPGTAHLWYGWRKQEYIEGAHNLLLAPHSVRETQDELSEAWRELARQRNPAPEAFNWEMNAASGWDIIWDNLCEVRKVS